MCTCDVEFYTRDVVLWCTGDSQIKSKSNNLCAIMSRMAQFVRIGFHKSLMGLENNENKSKTILDNNNSI